MKDDYKELLGKEVLHVDMQGRIYHGIVAGIDYEKGITVLDMDDPTKELTCLNKEDTYNWASYDDLFDYITLGLGMGIYSMKTNVFE